MINKKGFITTSEIVVLTIIAGIVAIVILGSTVQTTQNSVNKLKPKIERDLWRNS